jgi:hypothetical protein
MARFVGLDVSQKLTSICVVDDAGCRLWRGQCRSDPEAIERTVRGRAGLLCQGSCPALFPSRVVLEMPMTHPAW